jgi:catechol 2,3-dioxygenase-like lactoylglutathione lyase family enzyme
VPSPLAVVACSLHVVLAGAHHVALVTADLDRSCAFYAEVFDGEVPGRTESELRLGLGFVRLEGIALHIFERPDALPARGRIDHIGLRADSLDSFIAARDRLVERGATTGEVTDFDSLVSLFFEDPDGQLMELSLDKTAGFAPPFEVSPPRRG